MNGNEKYEVDLWFLIFFLHTNNSSKLVYFSTAGRRNVMSSKKNEFQFNDDNFLVVVVVVVMAICYARWMRTRAKIFSSLLVMSSRQINSTIPFIRWIVNNNDNKSSSDIWHSLQMRTFFLSTIYFIPNQESLSIFFLVKKSKTSK